MMADSASSATSGSQAQSDVLSDGPRRILIADDEHLVVTDLAASLCDLGYETVGPAADGDSAIQLCATESPDMALLDIRMPGMNGLEAAQIISVEHKIPVVIVSAYSEGEYVSLGQDAGVFGYLLKPVTTDQLRVAIPIAWGRWIRATKHDAEIENLNVRLEQRKTIEKAKWALVSQAQMTEPDAMRLLQRDARNNRRPLVDVASDVINNNYLISSA